MRHAFDLEHCLLQHLLQSKRLSRPQQAVPKGRGYRSSRISSGLVRRSHASSVQGPSLRCTKEQIWGEDWTRFLLQQQQLHCPASKTDISECFVLALDRKASSDEVDCCMQVKCSRPQAHWEDKVGSARPELHLHVTESECV